MGQFGFKTITQYLGPPALAELRIASINLNLRPSNGHDVVRSSCYQLSPWERCPDSNRDCLDA